MIPSKEISVVVQGAVLKEYTKECLRRIRRLLPGAQIILSTWEHADLYELIYDDAVLSKDPGGPVVNDTDGLCNNVNRQIVSTKEGLLKAERKFTLKTRADIYFDSLDFIQYFKLFDTPDTPAELFENRILLCNYYTVNPRASVLSYHPSDWLAFGNTKDLLAYYSVPLQPDGYFRWFDMHKKRTQIYRFFLSRYTPEQFVCISFLLKNGIASCDNYYDNTKENIIGTEMFFAKNTIVLDYRKQIKMEFKKYNPNRYADKALLLCHKDWLRLYHRYAMRDMKRWRFYLLKMQMKRLFFLKLRSASLTVANMLYLRPVLKKLLNKKS